jgi:hypothetical protein
MIKTKRGEKKSFTHLCCSCRASLGWLFAQEAVDYDYDDDDDAAAAAAAAAADVDDDDDDGYYYYDDDVDVRLRWTNDYGY